MTTNKEEFDRIRRQRDAANTANRFLENTLRKTREDLNFVTKERDRLALQLEAEQQTMREVVIDNSENNQSAVDEVRRLRKLLTENEIEIGG